MISKGDKVKVTLFSGQEVTGVVDEVLASGIGIKIAIDPEWIHLGVSSVKTRSYTKKCWKPVAAGPEGVAICILEEGHEGSCDGGELERRIGENFAAYQMEKRMEYDDERGRA